MRFLVVPIIASREFVRTESNFIIWESYTKCFGDRAFSNIIMFSTAGELRSGERVAYHTVDTYSDYYAQQVLLPKEVCDWFHPVYGKYPVEAVLCARVAMSGYIRRLLWGRGLANPIVPVVTVDPKVSEVKHTHNIVFEEELFYRSAGYAYSYTLFGSKRERDSALSACRRYLSPNLVARVTERSVAMPFGIDCDLLDRYRADTPKADKFTLMFTGRMNLNKNWEFACEHMDKFFRTGRPVRTIVTTPLDNPMTNEHKLKWPEIEVFTSLPRNVYWKVLCSSHVAISASKEEGWPVGLAEAVYAGVVVFFPTRDWVWGMFPKSIKEYPFVYSNSLDLMQKLAWVYDHYDEAQKLIQPARQELRDWANLPDVGEHIFHAASMMVEEARKDYPVVNDVIGDLLNKCLDKMPAVFSLDEFEATLKTLVENPSMVFGNNVQVLGFPPKLSVYRYILDHGYSDMLDDPVPMFVRK